MNKLPKALSVSLALIATLLATPMSTLALGDTIEILPQGQFSGLNQLLPSHFVSTAINLLLAISGVIAFFFLLIGGIQWILAGGDKEGTEKARKRITNSLIGLAVVLSAYALLFILQTLFGINVIEVPLQKIGT